MRPVTGDAVHVAVEHVHEDRDAGHRLRRQVRVSAGGTAVVIRLTRPSAGETTSPSRTGVTRSGSRKK